MHETTKICVARHGETDWNVQQILQGWIDVPVNSKGLRQAHELAETLASFRFSRVYTSPLQRAAKTAEIIAARLHLAHPTQHPGLKERNFGVFQGIPKAEMAVTHPELLQEILRRNPAAQFEQGETLDGFADRVLDGLEDIARHNAGKRVLVITHGWVMDAITRHIRHLPRTAILNLKRKNIECLWLDVTSRSHISASHDGNP